MKLSEHFKKTIQQPQVNESKELIAEVMAKVKEYENVFIDGINSGKLTVHEDGSISYVGEIEFDQRSYVDNTRRLPFKFKKVHRFVLLSGYADKLESLEGCPEECYFFMVDVKSHKPPAFFEGHFPKKAKVIDISVHSLQNCKFGAEQIIDKLEISVGDGEDIKSFEGLPSTINRVIINNSPEVVRSYKGFPTKVNSLNFYGAGDFDVKDLAQHCKQIGILGVCSNELAPNTPILSLFKIKIQELKNENQLVSSCKKVFKIVNKYLDGGDVFECQEELIDSGFEQFARTK